VEKKGNTVEQASSHCLMEASSRCNRSRTSARKNVSNTYTVLWQVHVAQESILNEVWDFFGS